MISPGRNRPALGGVPAPFRQNRAGRGVALPRNPYRNDIEAERAPGCRPFDLELDRAIGLREERQDIVAVELRSLIRIERVVSRAQDAVFGRRQSAPRGVEEDVSVCIEESHSIDHDRLRRIEVAQGVGSELNLCAAQAEKIVSTAFDYPLARHRLSFPSIGQPRSPKTRPEDTNNQDAKAGSQHVSYSPKFLNS